MTQVLETIVNMSSHGTFLGTRFLGEQVRGRVLLACESSERVIIDFAGIDEVSHSFADECFGVLMDSLGSDRFRRQIRFKNTTGETAGLLRLVMSRHANHVLA